MSKKPHSTVLTKFRPVGYTRVQPDFLNKQVNMRERTLNKKNEQCSKAGVTAQLGRKPFRLPLATLKSTNHLSSSLALAPAPAPHSHSLRIQYPSLEPWKGPLDSGHTPLSLTDSVFSGYGSSSPVVSQIHTNKSQELV